VTTTLLLHLMLRHGADAMADAILDGCEGAVRGCARFGSAAVSRLSRVARSATLRPMPVRLGSASSPA
jgi:hypothetical protein